jgi:putative drug exporter of the RND superfamily
MSTYLYRLARWSHAHRRVVLALWLVITAGVIALSGVSGGTTNNTLTIPGTESQQAQDLLFHRIPALAGGQMQVVFATRTGPDLNTTAQHAGVEQALTNLRAVPQVVSVRDPYQAKLLSPNGRIALSTVQFSTAPADVPTSTLDQVTTAVTPARTAGVEVEYSGTVYPGWQTPVSETPELIGLAIALVILLITFGSFVAAGLPILTALIGVGITLTGITAMASVADIASAATTVALMLGLSCGIDYGLFILLRHRDNLLRGMAVDDSIALAVGTAGSSVVFAALTVIIALCGLTVVQIPFLTAMGLCAAAAVTIALLLALTLMPAMLGFAGTKVTRFLTLPRRPGRTARTKGSDRPERTARRAANEPEKTAGASWARFVVRHRVPVLVGVVALLGVIALPALDMQLGLPSGSSKPVSTTQRRAYDLLSQGFGPGFNGGLLIVADDAPTTTSVQPIATALAKVPDVLRATVVTASNNVAVIQVIPATGPSNDATATLVNRIRTERTSIEAGTGARLLVGGLTASNIDVSAKLSSALPEFLIVVIGLAFLLLTFAFRTILVPIKSILGFLLSVAAAFGAQVAIFQWGWGAGLLGITPGQTVSFLPILMLAIIFGLSSDYEVFVVSRIHEDFTRHGDARAAVVRGTGQSARVVTSAALIMFTIFVSFMLTDDPTVKAIGFSFSVGVFLDAFVIRLTLVPAVMAITGARIWHHPRWFARHVPNPDIEGRHLEAFVNAEATRGTPADPALH